MHPLSASLTDQLAECLRHTEQKCFEEESVCHMSPLTYRVLPESRKQVYRAMAREAARFLEKHWMIKLDGDGYQPRGPGLDRPLKPPRGDSALSTPDHQKTS